MKGLVTQASAQSRKTVRAGARPAHCRDSNQCAPRVCGEGRDLEELKLRASRNSFPKKIKFADCERQRDLRFLRGHEIAHASQKRRDQTNELW